MTKQTSTPASLIAMPESYGNWLSDLKSRIQTAQQRAARAVNRELVVLYWQIGKLAKIFYSAKRSKAGVLKSLSVFPMTCELPSLR